MSEHEQFNLFPEEEKSPENKPEENNKFPDMGGNLSSRKKNVSKAYKDLFGTGHDEEQDEIA